MIFWAKSFFFNPSLSLIIGNLLAQHLQLLDKGRLCILSSFGVQKSKDNFPLFQVEGSPVCYVSSKHFLLERSFADTHLILPKRFEVLRFFLKSLKHSLFLLSIKLLVVPYLFQIFNVIHSFLQILILGSQHFPCDFWQRFWFLG